MERSEEICSYYEMFFISQFAKRIMITIITALTKNATDFVFINALGMFLMFKVDLFTALLLQIFQGRFCPGTYQVILAGTLTGVQGDIRCKVLAALSTEKWLELELA